MFGFGKKKKKDTNEEFSLTDLSYLNKKELSLHTKLKERLNEHLLDDEIVIGETSCAGTSYFCTDRRVITINGLDRKAKKVKADSIYYKEISSVTYSDGILGFGSLVIHLQGNIEKPWSTLYEKPCKAMYKLLNSKLSYNN